MGKKWWLRAERGSSLAWTAAFLGVVLIPLMLLVGDGARLYYVRSRLSQATDAACEEFSWLASDRLAWQVSQDAGYATSNSAALLGQAQKTFAKFAEGTRVPYTSSLALTPYWDTGQVMCQGQAQARLLLLPGQEVTIRVTAYSRMRFYNSR